MKKNARLQPMHRAEIFVEQLEKNATCSLGGKVNLRQLCISTERVIRKCMSR